MSDIQPAAEYSATPADPAMAASDPAMFASLSADDNWVLRTHLTSGWYKQAVVYPALSEPWKETSVVLDDISDAYRAGRDAQRTAQPEQEPEAGQ